MHHRRNNQVKPEVFRQRVRRFPRDEMLRGIARMSAQEALRRDTANRDDKRSVITEGYLFQIAGICVTSCNNHRSRPVDDDAVGDLLNGLHNVWSPNLTKRAVMRSGSESCHGSPINRCLTRCLRRSHCRVRCACSATIPGLGSPCSKMVDGRRSSGCRWRSS